MTPDQKPEWFQIADADKAATPRKISKGLPVMAMVAVAAILGVGSVVAQTQDEPIANATESVAPAVVDSTQPAATSTSVPSQKTVSAGFSSEGSDDELSIGPVPSIPAVHATNSAGKETLAPATTTTPTTTATTNAPKAPSAPGIANPLGKKPTGGEHEGHDNGGEHDNEGEDD